MEEQKYCETCKQLNEDTTPCTCKKTKEQVSYRRKACEEYKEDKKKYDA